MNRNNFNYNSKIEKYFDIYRNETFDDLLNFGSVSLNLKIRQCFYEQLDKINDNQDNSYTYNYLKIEKENFLKINKNEVLEDLQNFPSFIFYGMAYGYFNKYEIIDLYKSFNFSFDKINNSFKKASISDKYFDPRKNNLHRYRELCARKNSLKDKITTNISHIQNISYNYLYFEFSKYTINNYAYAKILESMVNAHQDIGKYHILSCEVFSQGNIYMSFVLNKNSRNISLTLFKEDLNNFIESIKENYTKPLDTVGDKIYYLYISAFDNLRNRQEDMEKGCIYKANTLLNKGVHFSSLETYDEINWEIFTDNVYKFLDKVQNYVIFLSQP